MRDPLRNNQFFEAGMNVSDPDFRLLLNEMADTISEHGVLVDMANNVAYRALQEASTAKNEKEVFIAEITSTSSAPVYEVTEVQTAITPSGAFTTLTDGRVVDAKELNDNNSLSLGDYVFVMIRVAPDGTASYVCVRADGAGTGAVYTAGRHLTLVGNRFDHDLANARSSNDSGTIYSTDFSSTDSSTSEDTGGVSGGFTYLLSGPVTWDFDDLGHERNGGFNDAAARTHILVPACDNTTAANDGDVLTYDSATGRWGPQAPSSGPSAGTEKIFRLCTHEWANNPSSTRYIVSGSSTSTASDPSMKGRWWRVTASVVNGTWTSNANDEIWTTTLSRDFHASGWGTFSSVENIFTLSTGSFGGLTLKLDTDGKLYIDQDATINTGDTVSIVISLEYSDATYDGTGPANGEQT